MEYFYYSIKASGKDWEDCSQYQVYLKDWDEFINFCSHISIHFNQEVRGSITSGFKNQGHYFKEHHSMPI